MVQLSCAGPGAFSGFLPLSFQLSAHADFTPAVLSNAPVQSLALQITKRLSLHKMGDVHTRGTEQRWQLREDLDLFRVDTAVVIFVKKGLHLSKTHSFFSVILLCVECTGLIA